MRKIELLAPAGDLDRLKYAVRFGADAVFIGGKEFSLRSMASNFSLSDIREGCEFAHKYGSKVHVTCNIVMHESDLPGLLEYLKALENAGVDAIISSSLTIIKLVKEQTKMEAHVSTQQSVSNVKAIDFFAKYNADRVVLARECSIYDIEEICKKVDTDIEVFIEGGMCASFSGRCMLSNVMTNRDANRGGCAQSCRWNYDIVENGNKVNKGDFDFTMSSADLNAIMFIPRLIDAGVTSLKIEGRMKSLHYVATIVNVYRRLIDEYYENGSIKNIQKYINEIKRGENRPVSHGFLNGNVTCKEEIYDSKTSNPNHDFGGIILSYDKGSHKAIMEQRNVFEGNREIEILSPHKEPFKIRIGDIYNENGEVISSARHATEKISFYCQEELNEFDIVR